jgi:hypothetical protein
MPQDWSTMQYLKYYYMDILTIKKRLTFPCSPLQISQQDDSKQQASDRSANVSDITCSVLFMHTIALIDRKPNVG